MQKYNELVIGKVELDPDFPLHVAERFTNLLPEALADTDTDLYRLRNKFTPLVYYKAARQLFSTLTCEEQALLWNFRNVIRDQTEIPQKVADALSIIGHFDRDGARVQVKNAVHLFRVWMWRAVHVTKTEIPIWNNSSSLEYLKSIVTEFYNSLAAQSVGITISGRTIQFRPQYYEPPNGRSWYPEDYWTGDTLKLAKSCVDFLDTYGTTSFNEDFWRLISSLPKSLNLSWCDDSDKKLMEAHDESIHQWNKQREKTDLEYKFRCAPAPYTKSGRAAQLMTEDSENPKGSISSFKIPEEDEVLGWMYTPAKKVELKSRVRYTSNTPKSRMAALILTEDRVDLRKK